MFLETKSITPKLINVSNINSASLNANVYKFSIIETKPYIFINMKGSLLPTILLFNTVNEATSEYERIIYRLKSAGKF